LVYIKEETQKRLILSLFFKFAKCYLHFEKLEMAEYYHTFL